MAGHGNRAIVAAAFANGGIALAKFLGFLITGSGSMLAESVHSVADTGNQGLLLLGGRRATRAPSVEHEFGFARERYFWAFVVAVVLFTLGATFAVLEGIEKILHPHELESLRWAVGLLLVAVALESVSFRTAIQEGRAAKGELSWWQFIRHAKAPEIPIVLLEDFAALIGLVIALLAIALSAITDNSRWDGLGTLLIGLLLGVVAIILAIEMKSLLIGESAAPGVVERISDAIRADESVEELITIKTEHLGPDELLVAVKVQLSNELSGYDVADVINRIEAGVRAVEPKAVQLFIEPDMLRT